MSGDFRYDNSARAAFMSRFSAGLQAYYEWTLVCDVDEIVVPHPGSGKSIVDILNMTEENVLLSRGVDVLQMPGEQDFDFGKSVSQQRSVGIPTTAMCKPHLSRVPVRYSGGYHYVNSKLKFSDRGDGVVTLHLKWACASVRRSVFSMVEKTSYASRDTAIYAAQSVSDGGCHPGVVGLDIGRVSCFGGVEFSEFEEDYRNSLRFDANRKLWIGPHVNANFLVSLSGC